MTSMASGFRQLQRAGRIDDARIFRHERQHDRLRARRDDRLGELHDDLLAVLAGSPRCDADRGTGRRRVTTLTLRALAMPASPPVSLPTTFSLWARSLSRSTLGAAKRDAMRGEGLHLVHHGRGVQQGFGGNAADVQAHPAQRRIALHQHRLQSKIGGPKCRRVAARACAQHHDVAIDVGTAGCCPPRGREPQAPEQPLPLRLPGLCAGGAGLRRLQHERSAYLRRPCRRP